MYTAEFLCVSCTDLTSCFLFSRSLVFYFLLIDESVIEEMIVLVHISMLCRDMNHQLTGGLIWLRIINTTSLTLNRHYEVV